MLLAHISDLHVMPKGEVAYGRVDTAGMLREAVAHLNRLDPQPDASNWRSFFFFFVRLSRFLRAVRIALNASARYMAPVSM